MAVAAKSKIGHYQIIEAIGAGGMGEVYSAHDPRLGRDVAIKIIPASFAADANRLHRFEQEACATAALNHPNILAVHDVGAHGGCPYIVSELLEGQTLRDRLRDGPLPIRKVVDYALQIARGLAAAHDRGILHRDLKPDNIFVTRDGRIKILDFGLAKLIRPEAGAEDQTRTVESDPGMVVGTVGYMSPEQVRGKEADARSDLFSFGAVLYEMISGKRAFKGDSPADTLSAILKEEPPELTATNLNVPPALDRIVRHCLEKNPEERFRSAHDVAFALETLSGVSSASAVAVRRAAETPARLRQALLATAALVALALMFLLGRTTHPTASVPSYSQLTFKRGSIQSARFTPDSHNVIYGAAWNGKPLELFNANTQTRGSLPIGIKTANVQAVAANGDMLIVQNLHNLVGWAFLGTLARVPLTGGTPRPILDDVQSADFTPDGNIVVIHYAGQRFRLESPPGKVLYEAAGWISDVRVSPKGDLIAFIDHPLLASGDDQGSVAVVDFSGKKKTLTTEFSSAQGLAWSSSSREVWFTASETGGNRVLYAVTPRGRRRSITATPDNLSVQDISANGDVLLVASAQRREMFVFGPQAPREVEMDSLDWPINRAITPDGKYVLFEESGEGGGPKYSVFLAATDGSSNLRLGDGDGVDLSPDGQWALTSPPQTPTPLFLVPIGVGERRKISKDNIDYVSASFFPDGKRIVIAASEAGHRLRTYVQDLNGGDPTPVTPEGTSGSLLSPDGNSIIVSDAVRNRYVLSLANRKMTPIPGLAPADRVFQWAGESSVYVLRPDDFPAKVYRLDVRSGRKQLFKEFLQADQAGVGNFKVIFTPDGRYFVYTFARLLSQLYAVKGLQ